MVELRSYLAGQWNSGSGDDITLFNPADASSYATVRRAGGLAHALAYARSTAGPTLRELTFAQRGACLEAMAKTIHGEREALIAIAIANGGNTRGDAKFDIDGATAVLATYAEIARDLGDTKWLVEDEPHALFHGAKLRAQHIRLPRHGVAIHINAFNFPAWGMIGKAAVSLLAGMPVLTKPGTSSAALAHRIVELLVEQQVLPAGALQLLMGPAGDLLEHTCPQDVVAFTGSAATGRRIRTHDRVIEAGVRVNVEADSLNAVVIGPDVARGSELFDALVRDCTVEITQKAGQKCTAIRRIIAPLTLIEDLREVLVERLEDMAAKTGDPADQANRMGPLATAQQLADAREGVRQLATRAKRMYGDLERTDFRGEATQRGYFLEPLLFQASPEAAADPSAPFHNTEVFGPVATLLPYDGSAEQAAQLVAAGGGSLVSTVYSDDRAFVLHTICNAGPHLGRLVVAQEKMARASLPPGGVFAVANHGGPGRAGGGEELGGRHGLALYTQRLALQTAGSQLARLVGG
ncbi:MAG: 3,4-dehydroadipyl-CoA semialdehyde dehydrogenase [Nannocystaceae bacterium]